MKPIEKHIVDALHDNILDCMEFFSFDTRVYARALEAVTDQVASEIFSEYFSERQARKCIMVANCRALESFIANEFDTSDSERYAATGLNLDEAIAWWHERFNEAQQSWL